MYTLGQFREITSHLPDDFEIRIEAMYTPESRGTAPTFEIFSSQKTKEVVLLPQAVYISDGTDVLRVDRERNATI